LDAPALLPTLLDGLIWRSRTTENGRRRVNYYVKHLMVDAQGDYARAIQWVTEHGDAKIVCHPVLALVTDMIWGRVTFLTFLYGKSLLLFTLVLFIGSQSILNQFTVPEEGSLSGDANASAEVEGFTDTTDLPLEIRVAIFVCRCFVYICSMGQSIVFHVKSSIRDVRRGSLVHMGRFVVPEYLCMWQGCSSLILTSLLMLMLCMEPILHCLGHDNGHLFTEQCLEAEHLLVPYSIISAGALLLYFLLLSDLSLFSRRVSAFVLVCSRVISELALFMLGLTFIVGAFACAISALKHQNADFAGIWKTGLNLYKIVLGMLSGLQYDTLMDYPVLMTAIFAYVTVTVIFMLNLFIAQLNCAYQSTYFEMVGYARLNRGKIVAETMPTVPKLRWQRFVKGLRLDERVEFGEGDIGLAGGIQVREPASENITTEDMIRRFGGSTSPAAQWPEEESAGDEEDRFDRMEKLIEKAMKRLASIKSGKKVSSSGGGSFLPGSGSDRNSDGESVID